MESNLWLWVAFNVFVLGMLALDLGVFHREAHVVGMREAAVWSVVWIALALAFNYGIYLYRGSTVALEFLTGYLIEKSLSVDNIFVFLLIFSYFAVPAAYQRRVLFWGILGALIMRGVMIAAGAALIARFHWILYVFGAFLILTGAKMAVQRGATLDPGKTPVVRWFRRAFPVTDAYERDRFFVRRAGRWLATPLFIVLLVVETTDLVFAVDSIPAIFAVTRDPFIVYTSNVFAILGLRALYFLLSGLLGLRYLKLGLGVVLVLVGAKMMLTDVYKIPAGWSLAVIASVLAVSVVASLLRPLTDRERGPTGAGASSLAAGKVTNEPSPGQGATM